MTDNKLLQLRDEIVEFYSRIRSLKEKSPVVSELEKDPIFLLGIIYGEVRVTEAIMTRIEELLKVSQREHS